MITEEEKKRIQEILELFSIFPDNLYLKEALVPMKVRDPKDPKKMIEDPHGRIQQRRMDILDKDDPFNKPLMHWHTMPEHPVYDMRWNKMAEAVMRSKAEINFLAKIIKEKICN